MVIEHVIFNKLLALFMLVFRHVYLALIKKYFNILFSNFYIVCLLWYFKFCILIIFLRVSEKKGIIVCGYLGYLEKDKCFWVKIPK